MAEPTLLEPSVIEPPSGLLANPDDLSGPFLAEVHQARTDDSLKWLRSFSGAGTPAPADAAAPTAAAPPDKPAPPSAPPGAAGAGPSGPAPASTPADRVGAAGDALLRFAKDVGRGATIEAPAQIAGGAADAVREYAKSAQGLAEWLNQLINLKVPVPRESVAAMRRADPRLGLFTSDDSVAQMLADPFQYLKDRLPDIYKADTKTGGVVRSVAHFLTALAIGARVAGTAGVPAGTATMMTGGALADFAGQDPNAGRLADLLDRVPALRGPVTDFLKNDPNDPEILKRLKNAGEGLGLGMLTEGLARGLKMVRAGTVAAHGPGAAASLADDALDAARLRHGDIPPASIGLGDPAGALVTVRDASPAAIAAAKVRGAAKAADAGVPVDVVARGVAGDASVGLVEGKGVFVNFSRINTADDVKSVIDQVATAFAPRITARARGVQSNELTKALADDLGMTVQDVLQRRAGQPFNAEQALAAREIMNTTAQQLVDLSRRASLPSASQTDLFAFQKMLSIHTAVQTEVLAARTETARALQAWSIPSGVGGIEMSRNVRAALDGFGGDKAVRDVAARLASLTDAGATPAAINNLARASVLSRTGDAIREAWINGLLSGWKTHIVNTTSNAMAMMNAVLERRLAESISAARGAGGVVPGEAVAMMHGYVQASGEAFQMAWQALRHGKSGGWRGSLEDARPRAISADALGLADDALGRSVDFIGKAFNIPGRLMMTSDEFFKTMAYRAEVHAHSLRQATIEGLTGPELGARIQQLLLQPPEHIRLAAVDSALYVTFAQNTSTVGKALLEARAKIPGAFIVAPFVRTPVNVVNYGFEHSPLAPIVGQWRADIAAGGARADLAMARVAMGTTVLLTAIDMADRDLITGAGVHTKSEGGRKEVLQRQGWQPYSIKVGDKYIAYDRMDPVGMTIGMAANLSELVRRSDISPTKMDDLNEVVAATTAAISNTVVSKTYLQGISQFFGAMNDPAQNVSGWLGRLEGSLVPSAANATRQLVDPQERETMKIWDYVTSRIPGLSDSLPPRRDLWGEVQSVDRSGIGPTFNALSPMRVSQAKASPVDAEMQRLNMGVDRIKRRVDWDGVAVDLSDWPKVYDAYVRLAGNDLKHPAWQMGAKEFLDAVVSGKHPMEQVYRMGTDGDDGGKASFIKRTISNYRELARAQIMADPEFQDFAEVIRRGKEDAQAKRMPVTVR